MLGKLEFGTHLEPPVGITVSREPSTIILLKDGVHFFIFLYDYKEFLERPLVAKHAVQNEHTF